MIMMTTKVLCARMRRKKVSIFLINALLPLIEVDCIRDFFSGTQRVKADKVICPKWPHWTLLLTDLL